MKTPIGKQTGQRLTVLMIALWGIATTFAASEPSNIQVKVSESVTLAVNNVAKMAVADPALADVVLLSETEISVIGKKPGITTLTITHPGNLPSEIYRIEVITTSMLSMIRSLIEDPSVKMKEVGDTIILDGQVQDEIQLTRIVQIMEGCKLKTVNLLEVRKPRQISIRARVAEVNTTAAKNIGFRWFGPSGEIQYAMDLKNFDDITDRIRHGFLQPKSTSGNTPVDFAQIPSLDVILQLLVDNDVARLLAEPTLIARSGAEASFLVGEERPVVQTTATSSTVDYKKIGVHMKIKPVADSQNRITTTIHAEVSQVTGLSPAPFFNPIIGTKTADTTLNVNDGQTIVIGGLLENNLNRDYLRKVPWLAEIPLFGYLFRHRERNHQQREVLFFMTPTIVKDVDATTAGAARTPLMQQWNGTKSGEKLLEIPKRDEPTISLKGAPEEPKQPEQPKKAPGTNFGPARSGGK